MGSRADADADGQRSAAGYVSFSARLRVDMIAPLANALVKGGAIEALGTDEHKLDTELGLHLGCNMRQAITYRFGVHHQKRLFTL